MNEKVVKTFSVGGVLLLVPVLLSQLWAISVTEILETLNTVLGGSDQGLELLMQEQNNLKNRSLALQSLSTELKLSLTELQNQFDKMKLDFHGLSNQYQILKHSFSEYEKRESLRTNILIGVIVIEVIIFVSYLLMTRKE